MKKLSLIAGGVAGLAVATLLATKSQAADHLDSLTLAGNPMADINDVYAWMTSDGLKLNLIMTVSPADTGAARTFGPSVQYAIHVKSRAGANPGAVVGQPGGTVTDVICTFASNTSAQCWAVAGTTVKDYVMGDPSTAAGMTSASGKLKVHAAQHSDPFFFNLEGFRKAIGGVAARLGAGGVTFDMFGCPNNLTNTETTTIAGLLSAQHPTDATATPPCSSTVKDCFAAFNVKALVVQVDKTLVLNGTDTFVSVSASTHAAP